MKVISKQRNSKMCIICGLDNEYGLRAPFYNMEDSNFRKGDAKTAQDFIDHLSIFSLLANVADVKSLVIHPATTTHSQCTEEELLDQGIKPNTIRLSIGIEKVEDLIAALDAAFEAIK